MWLYVLGMLAACCQMRVSDAYATAWVKARCSRLPIPYGPGNKGAGQARRVHIISRSLLLISRSLLLQVTKELAKLDECISNIDESLFTNMEAEEESSAVNARSGGSGAMGSSRPSAGGLVLLCLVVSFRV